MFSLLRNWNFSIFSKNASTIVRSSNVYCASLLARQDTIRHSGYEAKESDWVFENNIKRFLFTTMVTTTSVMLYGAVSWNADMSVMFTPSPGVHSPTFVNACCLSFIKSNLKSVLRPSLNCIGPVSPLTSTCVSIKTIGQQSVLYEYKSVLPISMRFSREVISYIVVINVFIANITAKSSIDGRDINKVG